MKNANNKNCIKNIFTSEEQELQGYKQHNKKEASVEHQVKTYEYSQPEKKYKIILLKFGKDS